MIKRGEEVAKGKTNVKKISALSYGSGSSLSIIYSSLTQLYEYTCICLPFQCVYFCFKLPALTSTSLLSCMWEVMSWYFIVLLLLLLFCYCWRSLLLASTYVPFLVVVWSYFPESKHYMNDAQVSHKSHSVVLLRNKLLIYWLF